MTPAYAELVGWVCVFHLSSQRHPEVVPPEPTIQQRVQIQISQLPVPCPKPTITLTPGATPHDPVFLNLSQRSSLRLQILAASIPLQSGLASAGALNLRIWPVLLQLRRGDRAGSVWVCCR